MTTENLHQLFTQHPAVSTDSRTCVPESIFFALKGNNFDGNDYITQALSNGAAYAVSDRPNLPPNKQIIKVDNALATLQELARYHRLKMKTPIIAVTGTNGKTTTKELLAAVLSSQYETVYTEGNLNNHIGVPLTLLKLKPDSDLAIIEMGANHTGEIAALCQIANPDYGLITNIGKAHLEGFGSPEGVIEAKTELYEYLHERRRTVFANADNPVLEPFLAELNTVKYGTDERYFVCGSILSCAPYLSLEWKKSNEPEKHTINTHLVGKYNFENVLAAVCVAMYFKVNSRDICRTIGNYIPKNNRSQSLKTAKNNIVVDAYNANPDSMKAALDNFIASPDSPKMLILGDMRELGAYSQKEHQTLVNTIRQYDNIKQVLLSGGGFKNLDGIPPSWRIFPSIEDLLHALKTEKVEGYNILLKGSNGNQLEKTLEWL
ncbi:MAG: UDP-N-acetylmuramoyl-tripeptide--D-alanyl-D-alanine ligase [Dysgonamonadaceae bacterium]|jgi:UDP-N-acetylmuramoyl-tripeptide--D-alanyl-D-alanine ligase|nr:UDP-N-acetylmuramoyl-tripeptide--D-alanyl-D-alanine ligase [Dysgonamonadaceae bacterium]